MLASMTQGAAVAIRNAQDFAAAFNVSREALRRLELYERLLRQWQKAVNLVAPSTLDDIWQRHFADSAQLLALAPAGVRTWTDLGSGAGFPGLVIAILLADAPPSCATRPPPPCGEGLGVGGASTGNVDDYPPPCPSPARGEGKTKERGGGAPAARTPRVTLIESNARKAAFLREVVRQIGIGDRIAVDILSTRIETAATQASLPRQDVVSARALAPLDRLLTLAAPLFAPATVGLFMKGREAAQEIEAARKTWDFNVELVPSRTDPGAHIIVVRCPAANGSKAPKVPRMKGNNP
jgi:16S rRNA (guanine527-N7)-methyltransferase